MVSENELQEVVEDVRDALVKTLPECGFIVIGVNAEGGFSFASNATTSSAIVGAFGRALQWVAEMEEQPIIVAPGDVEN